MVSLIFYPINESFCWSNFDHFCELIESFGVREVNKAIYFVFQLLIGFRLFKLF